jgi:hypothetical protein
MKIGFCSDKRGLPYLDHQGATVAVGNRCFIGKSILFLVEVTAVLTLNMVVGSLKEFRFLGDDLKQNSK